MTPAASSGPGLGAALRLAPRMLMRSFKAGEARIILIALIVAVASLTTVSFFANRVERALERQAGELIAADLALVADRPIDPATKTRATALGLTTATTTVFPSMVSAGPSDQPLAHLAELKAVSSEFPLRGKLRLVSSEDQLGTPAERDAVGIPAPGTVWIAPQLVGKVKVKVGDRLRVGEREFVIGALIAREPDNVLDYFGIAPRVLLNADDLASTQLLQVGSRVRYRLLMAGAEQPIAQMRSELMARDGVRGQRVEMARDARSEVRVSLERASKFLSLAALLSVILAASAVALAARRYSERSMDAAAMMRCLGASRAQILAMNFAQFVMLAVIASVLGSLLGLIAQFGLASALASLFATALPPPTLMPWVHGLVVGLVLTIGFTLPPMLRLRNSPALRVIRRELEPAEPLAIITHGLGFLALAGLIVWRAGEWKLGLTAVAGFSATLLVAALLGWLMIRAVGKLRAGASGTLRFGLANLARRTGVSILQIGALGLGIMAILILTLVSGDLLERWQGRLPQDAPNRFAINIQADQLAAVKGYFAQRNLVSPDLYPMVRGRLVEIRGEPIQPSRFEGDRARRLAEREFNLSFAAEARPDNPIVAGKWWQPNDTQKQFSVEEGLAKTLGLKLGDTMTYDIGGTRFTGTITNLRKVEWDSFKPNFFVVASPGLLDGYPASYITSFRLPPGNEAVVNELVAKFPNISVIDFTAIMGQVKRITEQVSKAVEFVFIFALLAGAVVLYAAIVATQDERVMEGAIMRTLGAHRRQLLTLQAAEFFAIGLLAGAVAVAGAWGLGIVLAEQLLQVTYQAPPALVIWGLGAGALGVTLAGLLGVRKVVQAPPMEALRSTM
jgi:putative ABC transport system permease protein